MSLQTIGAVDSVMTTEKVEAQLVLAEQQIATGLKLLPITGEERNTCSVRSQLPEAARTAGA
jgi:hypothetical protein